MRRGGPVPIQAKTFTHVDEARAFELGYELDIFEEEQKIFA